MHYFINYILANLITVVLRPFDFWYKRNIWILGGSGGEYYSDNSATLHKHIDENHPEIELYWIINKNSPDKNKIKNKNQILYKHSLRANLLVMRSKVLIFTHGVRGDIMRASSKKINNAITVDLFHGITAFKDKVNYPKNDLVIATSEEEKNIKLKWPNNNEDNIIITGFPRFDDLFKIKDEIVQNKEIFYMPTWRPWLKKDYIDPSSRDIDNFRNSTFHAELYKFLSSKKLSSILDENGYTLNVFVHMNMHQYIEQFDFDNKNIKLLQNNINVQEYIINSEMLITDYSSVAWDNLYLNKPTFFYVFDLDEYQNHVKSCIKMPEELFGPVAFNSEEMITNLEKHLTDNIDFNLYPIKELCNRFIKYDDDYNCERIINNIKEKIRI